MNLPGIWHLLFFTSDLFSYTARPRTLTHDSHREERLLCVTVKVRGRAMQRPANDLHRGSAECSRSQPPSISALWISGYAVKCKTSIMADLTCTATSSSSLCRSSLPCLHHASAAVLEKKATSLAGTQRTPFPGCPSSPWLLPLETP